MMGEFSLKQKAKYVVAASVIVGIFLLIVSEVTIRVFDRLREDNKELNILAENPYGTGSYRLRKNVKVSADVEGKRINVRTNSKGMHWRETTLDKPAGIKRIAFVGDSFTFGMWASTYENSLVGAFDALLPDDKFEVLNFGVPGFGFQDMELLIKEEVIRYEPDFVILVMYNGNDFQDTYLGLERIILDDGVGRIDTNVIQSKLPTDHLPLGYRSQASEDGTGSKISVRGVLREHSATYRRLYELKKRIEGRSGPFTDSLNASRPNFLWDSFFSRREKTHVAHEAIETVREAVGRIHDFLQSSDVGVYITAIPFPGQVFAEEPVGHYYDISLPQAYVAAFAHEINIPFYDLLPYLRVYVRGQTEAIYLKNDVHFNDAGHRLVGMLLHTWFAAQKFDTPTGPKEIDMKNSEVLASP